MNGELSPEDRRQLETLFERGAGLSPQEQAEFVERECASNSRLRAELARLLAAAAGRDHLDALQRGTALGPGTRIGSYKLLERVGEGGMGEVYAAQQLEPVVRRVALKVIKPGMDSVQVVARFEAERQALARMSHANVAQVFDGGTTSGGRPYFVMEYVAGAPITEYCDRRKLSTRARIELFLEICEGVQHAHQKGIIHRDLKPSNLLVTEQDGQPILKVIDFGVARAANGSLAEHTLHTVVGQLIGTLDYMSPEQADPTALDIDTRSDIYSLGVVLYQLVSGFLPFDHRLTADRALSDIQRAIREEDPPTPSTRLRRETSTGTTTALLHGTDERTLARQLAGDLDWIALKALEKDPARRYASASELADDLRRHLTHQPVLAGRPGVLYRAGKFVRRNRVAVTASVLVGAGLLAGIGGVVSGRLEAAAKGRELLRLADGSRLKYLLEEADRDLWPAHPDKIEPLEAWLVRARELVSDIEIHRETLSAIRSGRSRGRDAADPAGWRFDTAEEQWEHEILSELVAGLEAFEDGLLAQDAVTETHGWSVPKRLDCARRLRDGLADGGEWDARWKEAILAIGEHPAYAGLELSQQVGLVPIGPDGSSKLWEFWHVASGAEPARRKDDGKLVLAPETGLVLVLIPAGSFLMGAQFEDPQGDNYDPNSRARPGDAQLEYPVHQVVVEEAFFLSKFEMTQGQWLRIQGSRPSTVTLLDEENRPAGDRSIYSPLEPVNQVRALDCDEAMFRSGLCLPHEEQWEYAARAGTNTIWPLADFGDEQEAVEDEANVFVGMPFKKSVMVDAHPPNVWGLHCVVGNVTEWCANPPYDYTTGEVAETSLRAAKGGSFRSYAAEKGRSASRMNQNVIFHHPSLGLRPAREVDR